VRAFILALIFLAGFVPATAEAACDLREAILKKMLLGYKELPSARGIAANGSVIELLVSPDGETWTMMQSLPNGVSCMIATGESWEAVERKAPETPS